MSEIPGPRLEVLKPKKEQQVVFISGATGTYDGMRTIKGALHEQYGRDNVSVYNSVLFGDRPSPDRFQQMGADLKEKIIKGPTTVLAYSFGASETVAALDEIVKEDPNFFKQKENLDNLQLVLISPASFLANWRQGLRYGSKYITLGIQEKGALGLTLPGKTGILHGIVSSAVIPPEGVAREKLVKGIRIVSGALSKADGSVQELDFNPDRNYLPYLSEEERKKLEVLDTRLNEAIQDEVPSRHNRRAARKALRQRGRLTSKVVNESFRNSYSDDFGDPEREETVYPKSKEAAKKTRKLLWDTFMNGRVLGKMTEWRNAGLKINIIVPEQDAMMDVDDARDFLLGDNNRIAVASLSTHSGPWAPQPKLVVASAKAFEHQILKDAE